MSASRENRDENYHLLSETKPSCLTRICSIPKGIFSRLGSMAYPGGWVPGFFQSGSFSCGLSLLTKTTTGGYDLLGFILPFFGLYEGVKFKYSNDAAGKSFWPKASIFSEFVGIFGLLAPAYYEVYTNSEIENSELQTEIALLLMLFNTISNAADLYKLKTGRTFKAAEEAAAASENVATVTSRLP